LNDILRAAIRDSKDIYELGDLKGAVFETGDASLKRAWDDRREHFLDLLERLYDRGIVPVKIG
jgi:hypothetical protein